MFTYRPFGCICPYFNRLFVYSSYNLVYHFACPFIQGRVKAYGGKIFGSGSRTPIAITFLVKNPAKKGQKAVIHYHDIGDYLTREQKLKMVKDFCSISSQKLDWQIITPNEKADWINQRDGVFDSLISLAPEKKFSLNAQSVFSTYVIGVATNRDAWVSGFSKEKVSINMQSMIAFYNQLMVKVIYPQMIKRLAGLLI